MNKTEKHCLYCGDKHTGSYGYCNKKSCLKESLNTNEYPLYKVICTECKQPTFKNKFTSFCDNCGYLTMYARREENSIKLTQGE